MCLLDAVTAWDDNNIVCATTTHRLRPHPLASAGGRLGALAGIEYAAQAMAVHGALLAGEGMPPRAGMLGSARGVECRVARLDDIALPLSVSAQCLSADGRSQLYSFEISANGRVLVSGRATVVLQPHPQPETFS
jgi:predicted hotdog family 3-hydroxylacyl-ACP dehydratase